MKILYIGGLGYGGTAGHRKEAIERIIRQKVDTLEMYPPISLIAKTLNRIARKLLKKLFDFQKLNKAILDKNNSPYYDLIWVDKGLSITSATLKKVKELSPNTQLIHYSPDDMLNPDNQTIDYLSNIPIYDYHVTTKSYNVSELKELGAKNVVFVNNAFEPTVHRKIGLTPEEYTYFQSKVGFIGFFEQDRFEKMLFLANNGIKVKVWGETWKHLVGKYDNLEIIPINYWGEEYVKVLNGTTINLCFLRKVNRDAQTTRSVEIPACGGFMLAERTEEHLKLFKEGIEADFFFDEQELLKKVVYYLKNTERVNEIRENGYNRCLQHYSNDEMIKKVLEYIK